MDNLIPVESLHFVGNGSVAVGCEGADIIQFFAPCYSLPGIMTFRLSEPGLTARSFRIRGSAGYVTRITEGDATIGEMTDYTHPTLPVLIRRLKLVRSLSFTLESPFRTVNTDHLYHGRAVSRLFEIPDGTVIFSKSKTDKETVCQMLLSPNCSEKEGSIIFPVGESHLILVGGDYGEHGTESFANCMQLSDIMLAVDLDGVYAEFLSHWKDIFNSVRVNRKALSVIPDADELLEAVVTALVTQTSVQGGVIAGAFYHLAYGRDMYGVFRGYMALGLHGYARRMVEYMCETYRQKGYMPNASGMGMNCSHRHENDYVEQTGYYLLELLEYTEATGDIGFLGDRMDYARFLLAVQEKQLVNGMLPFNGDETYIAGGLFPRSGIDHGSMEATALYIGAATRLMDICEKCDLMDAEEITDHRALADAARIRFADNFTEGDTVYINKPNRIPISDTPAYRHGVCHNCLWMTNLLRTPEGGYLCPSCYGKVVAPVLNQRYSTDCAIWMSVFAGCSLLPDETVRAALKRTVEQARSHCFGEDNPNNAVGYEYGIILYTLAKYLSSEDLPAYRDFLDAILEDRVTGAVWTEYYRNGQPSSASCPYRPWESAINLCGIIAYLNSIHKGD